MNGGSYHCTGGDDQNYPEEKEIQANKYIVIKREVAFCCKKCRSSILDNKKKDMTVWPGVKPCLRPAYFLTMSEKAGFLQNSILWLSWVLLIETDPPSLKYLDLGPQRKGSSNPCLQASFCTCWKTRRRTRPSLECLLMGRRALGKLDKSSEEGFLSFSLLSPAACETFSRTRDGVQAPCRGSAES